MFWDYSKWCQIKRCFRLKKSVIRYILTWNCTLTETLGWSRSCRPSVSHYCFYEFKTDITVKIAPVEAQSHNFRFALPLRIYCLKVLFSHIQLHNTYTNICGRIVKNNIRTSMNKRTHFFIKNIPLPLYSRKDLCWLCVRGELETGTDCHILTQSSSDHSSTSFASCPGCSTLGHWEPKALSLQTNPGIFSPTDSIHFWTRPWGKDFVIEAAGQATP